MLTDDHWRKFCAAMEIEPQADLATLRDRRRERPRVEEIVRAAIAEFDYDRLAERLGRHGVGFTEVLSLDRVLSTPQARAPGKYSEFAFADYDFQAPDFPVPGLVRGEGLADAPPLLCEDVPDILERLGLSAQEMECAVQADVAIPADRGKALWSKPKSIDAATS